jgi:hypothetical protein
MASFFLEYFLYSGGIFLFSLLCRRYFVCVVIHLLHSALVLFILGVLGLWGVSSCGPGHILFLRGVPLCGVSVRYNLFECLLGVGGGAVQVFFFCALLW